MKITTSNAAKQKYSGNIYIVQFELQKTKLAREV